MSKHLGNILEPIPLMDRHGADARALVHAGRRLAVVGPPGRARGAVDEIVRKVLLTYWNTAVVLHAVRRGQRLGRRRAAGAPRGRAAAAGPLGALRAAPGRPPRSTRRWRTSTPRAPAGGSPSSSTTCPTGTCAGRGGGSGTATRPRWRTLHECLDVLTRLLAPFMPFVTEEVWRGAVRPVWPDAADSVHLARWPTGRRRRPRDDAAGRAGGAGPPAGRARPLGPHRRRRSRTRQPLAPGAGRRARLGRAAARTCAPRSPTSSTCRVGRAARRGGGDLVDVTREGRLPRAGPAVRQAGAGGGRGGRRGRPGRAGRRLPGGGRRRVEVDGAPVALEDGRPDRHRDAARGLDGGQRRRAHRGARPDRSRRSWSGPGWPARRSG